MTVNIAAYSSNTSCFFTFTDKREVELTDVSIGLGLFLSSTFVFYRQAIVCICVQFQSDKYI